MKRKSQIYVVVKVMKFIKLNVKIKLNIIIIFIEIIIIYLSLNILFNSYSLHAIIISHDKIY